jgi:zinc finger protein
MDQSPLSTSDVKISTAKPTATSNLSMDGNIDTFLNYCPAPAVTAVFSGEVTCPVCGSKTFRYVELLYETPFFGNVLIQSGYCSACGYRLFDVEYAEVGRPTRVIFTAKDGLDVAKSFLIRSKTGIIHSPDLGFSLEPGTHGDTFITTVEGFMYKVIDYAERLKLLEPEAAEKVDKFISTIYRKIEEGGFTLVVEDPLGKSFIMPYRQETVKVEHLDEARV